ncbi:peptide chain release factor N(5)-glutamine methyltransferase [Thiovibrio frasassiensis]|uniref:Release factor glutamine methyltransferase n=1 Tax=Thiovibrio frasassiensis TaxID=2984131 RepID=A0A9X4RQS6_9BACT|nr:peptide chain release factor N(5)-glutamine methyltransferase [Thiovibrio frasassiensis]MDG4476542.1 peptide chain release factor N(5)-glutamine methyltransferase [Thiovibrio frasassiensis]
MILKQLYLESVQRLADAGVSEPEIEAALLLGHVLNYTRSQFFLALEQEIPSNQHSLFEKLLSRRLLREPLAYITGEQEFWSLPFTVSRNVLIPRPETEELLEKVFATVRQDGLPPGPLLDLGVGSGAITVVLARELADRQVFGVDLSLDALTVARGNIGRHQVQPRVFLVNADWLTAFRQERNFALVVSNPPYIDATAMETLQPEVKDFEPHRALHGGSDGLSDIRALAAQVHPVMVAGGLFFMEIGADQREAVLKIFSSFPEYDRLQVHSDLAGLPRIFQARRC